MNYVELKDEDEEKKEKEKFSLVINVSTLLSKLRTKGMIIFNDRNRIHHKLFKLVQRIKYTSSSLKISPDNVRIIIGYMFQKRIQDNNKNYYGI